MGNQDKFIEDHSNKCYGFMACTSGVIQMNKCDRPKNIGNKVMVWDGSRSEDLETGENYCGYEDIFKTPLVIIKKDCDNVHEDSILNSNVNRDLVVYSEKYDCEVAVPSAHTRLVD